MENNNVNKVDRRIQYTKMFLRDALIELMKNKPIAKITPTELCRVANVNRNTFYAHYTSPSDLLNEIESELYNNIMNCVSFYTSKGLNLKNLCRAIKDNADLCKVILSENGDRNFLLKILASARDITLQNWETADSKISGKELNLYFNYCANGSVSIIYDWVNEGMITPYEDVARILEILNNAVMSEFIKMI